MSVFLYLGVPRCGKSTLMRKHVYGSRDDVRSFLIMDRDGKWDGPVFRSAAQVRKLELLPRYIRFRGASSCEVAELAIDLGDCVYVDDEVHRAIAERPWKPWDRKNRPDGHPLYAILHEGAHLEALDGEDHAVSAFLATHRPAGLPSDLPSMVDRVYVGRLQGWNDADRVHREGWLPRCSSVREALAELNARPVGTFSTWP